MTAVMLLVCGETQVLGMTLSSGNSSSISGMAGIGHLFTGVGILMLLRTLRKVTEG